MPMNLYTNVNKANGATGLTSVQFVIHWDNTKIVPGEDGTPIPDENFVEWYTFPAFDRGAVDVSKKAQGQADNAYRNQLEGAYIAQCKAEARGLGREKAKAARPKRLAEMGTPEVDKD